jgi:hypothetical protein
MNNIECFFRKLNSSKSAKTTFKNELNKKNQKRVKSDNKCDIYMLLLLNMNQRMILKCGLFCQLAIVFGIAFPYAHVHEQV